MSCSGHFRVLLLTAAILLPGAAFVLAQGTPATTQANNTEVHLRWGPRPGVSRYRLQLATDSAFADIQFDRVVAGNEYEINDLAPGRYFWRIAPLTDKLGEFSSAGTIEARRRTVVESPTPRPDPPRLNNSSPAKSATPTPVLARGGWRAAVGDIADPVLAHLRSAARFDLVGVNSEGVIFALDAASGVAWWSTGYRSAATTTNFTPSMKVLLVRAWSGLDNPLVLSGLNVVLFEGATGHEVWRTLLPARATAGAVVSDNRSAQIILIDNVSPRLFILDAKSGNLLAQIHLPHRLVGSPLALPGADAGRIVLAYEGGQIEVRDSSGALVRSGDAGSTATTPPLFVKGPRGDFIMVGTQSGLAALTADELKPLGMVALKDDAPRGTLAAEDLDGDGSPEVIMLTARGRVVAVSAIDGRTVWEANVGNESQAVAFADVDGDRVFDVIVADRQSFALALSGRDGSVVWKDNEPPTVAANHSLSTAPRSILAMSYVGGALLIAGDSSHTGLRALGFPKGTAPLSH